MDMSILDQEDDSGYGHVELDSHADTCVAGSNCRVISFTGKTVTVTPFSGEYNAMPDIPIATVGTAYDCPTTGQVYILVTHESLWFGERLGHTLWCPNQLRDNGMLVQDVPKQWDELSSHSIYCPAARLRLPLKMKGVVSYIETRLPTQEEIDDVVMHVELTSDDPWDPHTTTFAEREEKLLEKSIKFRISSAQSRSIPKKNKRSITTPPHGDISHGDSEDGDKENQDRCDDAQRTAIPRSILSASSEQDGMLYDRLISKVRVTTQDGFGPDGLVSNEFMDPEDLPAMIPREAILEITSDHRELSAMATKQPHSVITRQKLADKWSIGLEAAERTLRVTTQNGMRSFVHPVQKRAHASQPHLRHRKLLGKFYSDSVFLPDKSIRGYIGGQLTTNGCRFTRFNPFESKAFAYEGIVDFIHHAGIPEWLITDGSKEQTISKRWRDSLRGYHIRFGVTEPYSPWQNAAEGEVREWKRRVKLTRLKTHSPKRLWCFLGEHEAAIRRLTATDNPRLHGRSAHENVLGWTPDISNYIRFAWWEWVFYLDHDGETQLGKWIGFAEDIGAGDCFWLLARSAEPIARSTVWAIPEEELAKPEIIEKMNTFLADIESRLGDDYTDEEIETEHGTVFMPMPLDLFEGELDEDDVHLAEPEAQMPEADDFEAETGLDNYLASDVFLPRGGEMCRARVAARATNENGDPIGRGDTNPILDTRMYDVVFEGDGATETYSANLIAEHMFSQVDEEGHHFELISEIINHETDGDAVTKDDGYLTAKNGKQTRRITTKGWKLLVEWKNGSSSWVPLKDMKEAFPVQCAEYAVANKISEEPAFAWWIHSVLRKRDRILMKVKSKFIRKSHKYGVEIPKSVQHALQIDERTGTTFWSEAIKKEMKNVMVAFELSEDDKVPIGYTEMRTHMVFDIKLVSLTRKARLVANGNELDAPKETTFSSVVSRDSVRMFFLLAALNDLDVLSGDIQNAYLTAETSEKLWTKLGDEFGPAKKGRIAIVVRALYGLKGSGKAFRDHLAKHLRAMKFKSCRADPDIWMRAAVKQDGTEYWEYIITYVDDVCACSMDPKAIFDSLAHNFTWKPGSVMEPELYLGAAVKKWYIANDEDPTKVRWAMSSTKYTKKAIADVETELRRIGKQLPTKVTTPLSNDYRPELDQSKELDATRLNYFQGLVGVLRWTCELGRLDILQPLSLMSRYLVSAREGHLDQLFHIFGYLKLH